MKEVQLIALIVASLFATASQAHASAWMPVGWTPLGGVGPWKVYSKKSGKTGKLSCVAYYEGDHRIQFTLQSFSLIFDGGIRDVKIDLDGEPMQFNKTKDLYQVVGAVHIAGVEFQPISQAHQMRLQIDRLQDTALDLNVNLTSLPSLMNFFTENKCEE